MSHSGGGMKKTIAQAALLFLFNVVAWPQCLTLVSIVVTPQTPTITKGSTQQFVATGTFTDGAVTIPADISSSPSWSSTNTLVATVYNAALATTIGTAS